MIKLLTQGCNIITFNTRLIRMCFLHFVCPRPLINNTLQFDGGKLENLILII